MDDVFYGEEFGMRGSPAAEELSKRKQADRAARKAAKEEHARGVAERREARNSRRVAEAQQKQVHVQDTNQELIRRFKLRIAAQLLQTCQVEMGRPRCYGEFRKVVQSVYDSAQQMFTNEARLAGDSG